MTLGRLFSASRSAPRRAGSVPRPARSAPRRAGPAPRPVVDRASADDLAMLAMDRGGVPQQLSAVLLLDAGPDFDVTRAERLIADRIAVIPRLRQRLVRVPPGCGRAIWVDHAGFDIRQHVRHLRCRSPGDERALLDTAIEVILERLPRTRPLWSAVFITGLEHDAVALVVVLHHVLADGIGGLAVLAGLVQGVTGRPATAFPRHPPSAGRLALDAWPTRLRALSRVRVGWRRLRTSMSAGGGLAPTRAVACSLVQRTGPRRRLAVARADLDAVRTAAHRHGATVNDAVLTAMAGALDRVLAARGEHVHSFAVAVPVAGRRSASADLLGNRVSPLLVIVPTAGDRAYRLRQVAGAVRAGKAAAGGPPPIAVLGPVFRAVAALGGYHWYMNHQRRIHTLVSHVRGPERQLTFAGATIRGIIPVAVGEAGNMSVNFVVLSYAGTLTVTAVADPDHFPDLSTLDGALRAELTALADSAAGSPAR